MSDAPGGDASATTLRAELTRKALHLATASLPIAWSYGWLTTEQLRVLLTAAVCVALAIEALRRVNVAAGRRFDALVGTLLRGHERASLTGATWLAFAMALVVWIVPATAALVALWAAAVGDASAAIVGRSIAAWRGTAGRGKSFVGSLAAASSTALGCAWLAATAWPVAAALGLVAAMAEFPRRPGDDNLRVAFAVALAAVALGLR